MNRTFIPFCIVVHIAPSAVVVTRQSWGSNYIEFIYDESSQPFAMRYNGTLYYYVLNIQGDVVGLMNASGTMVATYTYDPWGKVISNVESGSLADVNPLRYRGYYYDSETGFYYLQSRYYDPAIGRFINADSYATTDVTNARSSNMFAYCENDPVNRSDPTGEIWTTVAKMAVGAAVSAATYTVGQLIAGEQIDAVNLAISAGEGALTAVSGTAVGAIISGVSSLVQSSRSGNDFKTALKDMAIGVGSSLIGGAGQLAGAKVKLNEFKNAATKRELKTLGNQLMGEHGNKYKSLDAWKGKADKNAKKHFMNSKYASYMGYLFGAGASISANLAINGSRGNR